ncbi:MAG: hypothetical protein PHI01_02620, partial [Candidatus Izemoplasmatales bacterium]|nr:hypothetical protein [Candidatus Izemoplasmatales bacterium]
SDIPYSISIPGSDPFKFGRNLNLFVSVLKNHSSRLTVFIVSKNTKMRQQVSELLEANKLLYHLIGTKDEPIIGQINLLIADDYFDLYAPDLGIAVIT